MGSEDAAGPGIHGGTGMLWDQGYCWDWKFCGVCGCHSGTKDATVVVGILWMLWGDQGMLWDREFCRV